MRHENVLNISMREKEVLQLISMELTTDEIASKLYISSHTAMDHRKHLLRKFHARNVAGLIRRAYEFGILVPKILRSKSRSKVDDILRPC